MTARIVLVLLAACSADPLPEPKWSAHPVCVEDTVGRVVPKIAAALKGNERERLDALAELARTESPDAVQCALRAYNTKDSVRLARVLELLGAP